MAKGSTRSSSRAPRPRRLATSVQSVIARLEAVRQRAEQRQEQAGKLKPAMEEGVHDLSEAIAAFRKAGSVAEELQILCQLIENRGPGKQALENDTPTGQPPADGGSTA